TLLYHVGSSAGVFLRLLPLGGQGSPRDLVVPDAVPISGPSLSQAGDQVCYATDQGLGVLDIASRRFQVLVPSRHILTEMANAIWAPDGRSIYYVGSAGSEWSIWSVGARGGTPRRLVNFHDPSRPPTRYGLDTDGRRFYVTLGTRQSDVWV